MTLRMLDSITPGNLPAGADAYLGYVDGTWDDFNAEVAKFPGVHILGLAVFPSDDAEGCDCEKGDLTPQQVPAWVQRQLGRGVHRPVVYTSASSMDQVVALLTAAGIQRGQVRLFAAHYEAGCHMCGPTSCGLTKWPCDATQWRDDAPGLNGSLVDESILCDDFFGGTMSATGPEKWDGADWAKFWAQTDQHAATMPYRDIAQHYGLWWEDKVWSGDVSTISPATPPWVTALVTSIHTSIQAMFTNAVTAAVAASVPAAVKQGMDPAAIGTAIAAAIGPGLAHETLVALEKTLPTT